MPSHLLNNYVSATGRDAATQVTKSEGSIKGIRYKVLFTFQRQKSQFPGQKLRLKKFVRDTSNFISLAGWRLSKEEVTIPRSYQMPKAPKGRLNVEDVFGNEQTA